MSDYEEFRKSMVEKQLKTRGIHDEGVLSAFLKVERHRFVPKDLALQAYDDHPIPIGRGQTISQPYIVALMTQLLQLQGTEKILEVGTGSGYQTAILAELAGEIYSLEKIQALAEHAKSTLDELGYNNITILTGDGSLGLAQEAPFDGIIVTAAAPHIPETLLSQLGPSGRMVIPVGDAASQILTLIKKNKDELSYENICGCVFVPLIGKEGWADK